MALKLYDKLTPSGDFALINADDVEMSDGTRLSEYEGLKGEKGDKGDTGETGPQGPKGDTGDTGPQGPKGDTGDTGPAGPEGPQGPAGPEGPAGPAGADGAAGPAGADGARGPAGYNGSSTFYTASNGTESTTCDIKFSYDEVETYGREIAYGDFILSADGTMWSVEWITADSDGTYVDCNRLTSLVGPKGDKGDSGGSGSGGGVPAASVDLTNFETNGTIVETYADGSTITYTMEFDEDKNPVKITDSNGNVTTLTGFASMGYDAAEEASF